MLLGIKLWSSICFMFLIFESFSYKGVEFNTTTMPLLFYNCYRQNYITYGNVEIFLGRSGVLDKNITQTLNSVKMAGLIPNVVFGSCRMTDPEISANIFINNISKQHYEKIWIYIYTAPQQYANQCNWNYKNLFSPGESCIYLKKLISTFKSNGIKPGIATTKDGWQILFKGVCDDVSRQTELFWITYNNNGQSTYTFNDFTPFGGWYRPQQKHLNIWGAESMCGSFARTTYFETL